MKLTRRAESEYRLQDYAAPERIDGVGLHELRRFHDDGGALTELLRLGDGVAPGLDGFRPAQINYACLQPGAIKAFHLHRRQTDVWFVPPEDRVLAVLVDMRDGSPTEGRRLRLVLGDGESALLRIPPGVAHGCKNLGAFPARLLYFTDLHFSPERGACDEGRLPWDLAGQEIWDVSIG